MYIAYCDDEKIQLDYMQKLVEDWSKQRHISCTFKGYESADALLFEYPSHLPFDALILDIDMRGMDGMALARRIREKEETLPILFLTNRREYVFDGYEVKALRYLMKPVDAEKIGALLDEIYAGCKKEKRYLVETIGGESVKIDVDSILSIEAKGHYILVHTKTGDYEYKKSLSEIVQELAALTKENPDAPQGETAAGFISTHRSFLVNLAEVERILKMECILSDGTHVPVSRSAYKAVNEAFIRYYRK